MKHLSCPTPFHHPASRPILTKIINFMEIKMMELFVWTRSSKELNGSSNNSISWAYKELICVVAFDKFDKNDYITL